MKGLIDDIRVYHRALAVEEVKMLGRLEGDMLRAAAADPRI